MKAFLGTSSGGYFFVSDVSGVGGGIHVSPSPSLYVVKKSYPSRGFQFINGVLRYSVFCTKCKIQIKGE